MQCVGSGTLVIACDGLYDVMSNEEIEKFVKESQGTVEERTTVFKYLLQFFNLATC